LSEYYITFYFFKCKAFINLFYHDIPPIDFTHESAIMLISHSRLF